MKTRQECEPIVEEAIVSFCRECDCNEPEDIRKALELLMSKASLAIHKYCGKAAAWMVVHRTFLNVPQDEGSETCQH